MLYCYRSFSNIACIIKIQHVHRAWVHCHSVAFQVYVCDKLIKFKFLLLLISGTAGCILIFIIYIKQLNRK